MRPAGRRVRVGLGSCSNHRSHSLSPDWATLLTNCPRNPFSRCTWRAHAWRAGRSRRGIPQAAQWSSRGDSWRIGLWAVRSFTVRPPKACVGAFRGRAARSRLRRSPAWNDRTAPPWPRPGRASLQTHRAHSRREVTPTAGGGFDQPPSAGGARRWSHDTAVRTYSRPLFFARSRWRYFVSGRDQ